MFRLLLLLDILLLKLTFKYLDVNFLPKMSHLFCCVLSDYCVFEICIQCVQLFLKTIKFNRYPPIVENLLP